MAVDAPRTKGLLVTAEDHRATDVPVHPSIADKLQSFDMGIWQSISAIVLKVDSEDRASPRDLSKGGDLAYLEDSGCGRLVAENLEEVLKGDRVEKIICDLAGLADKVLGQFRSLESEAGGVAGWTVGAVKLAKENTQMTSLNSNILESLRFGIFSGNDPELTTVEENPRKAFVVEVLKCVDVFLQKVLVDRGYTLIDHLVGTGVHHNNREQFYFCLEWRVTRDKHFKPELQLCLAQSSGRHFYGRVVFEDGETVELG
jgi:hypothetical protein